MARPKKPPMCPCGSGKAASDCCEGRSRRMVRNAVVVVLLVVVGTAVGMLSMSMSAGPDLPDPATAAMPAPYQYDPVTNQHWDPDHQHWHPGPPPASPGSGGVPAPPNIPNPKPWQYDEASNRHYDPGHRHWHSGPPPAGVDENTLVSPVGTDRVDPPPGVLNPLPWQYDEATDKYYHPGHRHWHGGPPPPEGQR